MKSYKNYFTFIGQLNTECEYTLYYFPLFLKAQDIDLKKVKEYKSDIYFNLLDRKERKILQLPLSCKKYSESSQLSVRGYIPFDERTQIIQFEYKGEIISTYRIQNHKPRIEIITKLPKNISDDRIELAWKTSYKGDSSLLEYKVLYSNDNGETWQRIGDRTKENRMHIDVTSLSGGSDCRLLVQVTDGYNNAYDEAKGFSIENKPNEVMVVMPVDGDILSSERSILLNGQAYNYNTGEEITDGFRWTSSIDGELGVGSLLQVGLTKGDHTIQLQVGERLDSVCLHIE